GLRKDTRGSPPQAVLSCCRPDMGWQSWRFEGQAHESPHIFVFNMRQGGPVARLLHSRAERTFAPHPPSWPGLTRLRGRSPFGAAKAPATALARDFARASCAYLSSTFAPAFSSWALILSASSLLTLSLTGFGAPSTRSFASLRPRPVMARTSLMTSIFLSPAAARTTVNSVFSSTGAAAAPPPAGPA